MKANTKRNNISASFGNVFVDSFSISISNYKQCAFDFYIMYYFSGFGDVRAHF